MELELGSAEKEETREKKSPRSRFSEEEANTHEAKKNVP